MPAASCHNIIKQTETLAKCVASLSVNSMFDIQYYIFGNTDITMYGYLRQISQLCMG